MTTGGADAARVFTAPGKLVLCGEYAVLEGKPAVVAAVDRRARASWTAGQQLRVRGNDPRWLPITAPMLEDDGAETEQPLLVAVLRELHRRGMPPATGEVRVDTSSFLAAGDKLGLGSSAAAAAAFTATALAAGGDVPPAPQLVFEIARAAHRRFQGGGSGIDVAASCFGGLLLFEQGAARPAPPLPRALSLVVAYTGVAARTQGFVDAFQALANRADHVDALHAATVRFLAGADTDSAGEVLAAFGDAHAAMGAMGEAAGIDVITPELSRIAAIATRHDGAAKPSGAGGGDIAVCLVPRAQHAALSRALEEAGFPVVGLQLDASGVRLER